MATTGISQNGTKWTLSANGNVELKFADGSNTTVNPTALGMTIEDAIMMFEHQMQQFNAILNLSDDDYQQLIEDIQVDGTNIDLPPRYWEVLGLDEIPMPSSGLADGVAMLPIFMSLSSKGLQNIISLLGFFPIPTINSLNQQVIGYQHVVQDGEEWLSQMIPMAIETAVKLLLGDIYSTVIPLLQNLLRVPLTQQQFDSLIGSALSMGPTRFAQSGIPNHVNSGDFGGAGRIRECYNGTNGEYDPAKAHAADTQSLGIQKSGDGSVIADPNNNVGTQDANRVPNIPLHTPVNGLVSGINEAAHTSSKYTPEQMGEILYGFAHHESMMGTRPTNPNSTAYGPYHILRGTWADYVMNYGHTVPALKGYSDQMKVYGDVKKMPPSLIDQVSGYRNDPRISSLVMVQAIDNLYTPGLQKRNLPINAGSLWNYHYLPASVSSNVARRLNWDSVGLGKQYASRYFR